MSEKRFIIVKSIENLYALIDKERDDKEQIILLSLHKEQLDGVVDLLNEQQEYIRELQISDEMGWKRAEKFEKECPKELHNKKMYIKRLEYKVQKFKEENEQLRFALRTEQALARVEKDNRPFLSKEEFLKELENE